MIEKRYDGVASQRILRHSNDMLHEPFFSLPHSVLSLMSDLEEASHCKRYTFPPPGHLIAHHDRGSLGDGRARNAQVYLFVGSVTR